MQADQRILQMSWVVRDLEEAALRWHRTTGIGPFIVNRHIPITGGVHRGTPQKTDFSTAIAQAGSVQVELVEQHDDSPSCYRDMVAAGNEGMHHVAVIAEDYDAAVARYTDQGHEIASSGNFGEVRFCYIDTAAALGHMIEILEDSRAICAFFAMIARAAEEWDGDTATLLREL
ncbi:VOC family protein [Allopontixanthobacter sediminis]|uniref:ABC transporter permease n=1 Tax=Allopontixanthobacter sediminis TaxID=1689985 RepID=A0A845AY64_9SPHN|nr:VOC family protein [Allopontixanthobacter sediminis]MXP42866.1 ABC transporter permease [Allopontixanthobacter sediminis]